MQLEMGISTRRYLPARGTAGLARSFVRGNSRVPWPPPMITESTSLVLADCRPVCDIVSCVLMELLKPSVPGTQEGSRGEETHYRNSKLQTPNFKLQTPGKLGYRVGWAKREG